MGGNKMKQMKKIFSLSLALLLLTSMVMGCSKPATTPTNVTDKPVAETSAAETKGEEVQEVQEPVLVKMWMRGSSKENNITATMDKFNASQDRIKVEVEVYGDNYAEILKLAFNSGEAPDIFELAGGIVMSDVVAAGQVEPLDSYITDQLREDFSPSAFTYLPYQVDGTIYAIPEQTRYMRLLYNKDLFVAAGLDPEQPPRTLEEMYEYAKKITEAGKGEFFGFGLPMKSGSTWERNIDNIATLSGLTGTYGFDYKQGKFDFSKHLPILKYFSDMYKENIMMPGSETLDIEMVRANFSTNKIGMYIDGSWTVNMYNNEQKVETNWESSLIPIFEGTNRATDVMTLALGRCISSQSEVKDEAFEALVYRFYNLEYVMAEKNPDNVPPAFSLITKISEEINAMPSVQEQRGIKGFTTGITDMAAFSVTPHSYLTLEGDNRDSVYPLLIITGENLEQELAKLSDTYNKALAVAIEEGKINEEDLSPAGFDYYNRK